LPEVLLGPVAASVDEGTSALGSMTGGVVPTDVVSPPPDAVLADIAADARGAVMETVTGGVGPVSDAAPGTPDALFGTVAQAVGGAPPEAVIGGADPVTGAVGPVGDGISQADLLLADVISAGGASVQNDPSVFIAPGPAGVVEPASPGGDVFGGLPFDALPALGGEQALLLSAGLAAAAGLAVALRAGGPSAASVTTARFLLANAPPIPVRCMVGATVNRASAAVTGAAGFGGHGEVLGVHASAGNGGAGLAGDVAAEVAGRVGAIGRDLRDGFLNGAGRALPGPDDGGEGNTPLWMVAMMLGTVYLAIISACIWIAKGRWQLLR
jgi:hypothetical protein